MTTTITPRIQYTAIASQTVFTFSWEFFLTNEIVVYYIPLATGVQTLLATSAYSVTSPSATGGSITLVTPASAGDIVTILRVMALTSIATFSDAAPYNAQLLNDSYNNVIYMVQGLQVTASTLTPTYVPGTPVVAGVDTNLPQLAANQIWVKNSSNTAIIAVGIPGGTTNPGTVTNIDTGAGLTGGPITTTGTISVANGAITPAMIQVQTAGRLGGYTASGAYVPVIVGSGLTFNTGTNTLTAATGSGTVTSVATGTGLTGGTITGAGTISVATSTANTLAGYNSSGVFSGVTVSTGLSLSGGVLTASGGGAGAYTKISTQTASNSASIVFTGLVNTFSKYVLSFSNVKPVIAGNGTFLLLEVSTNGGSTWVTTADFAQNWGTSFNSTYAVITQDVSAPVTTGFFLTGASFPMTSATAYTGSGTVDIYGAGVTGLQLSVIGSVNYVGNSGSSGSPVFNLIRNDISGTTLATTNVNAIRIIMSPASNISTGTFELCGITA